MKDLNTVNYHPIVDRLSEILCQRTRSNDPSFFRLMVSYFLVKATSMMHCSIATPDRGKIPINMYVINLAVSGHGKGHSMNILEDMVLKSFRERFLNSTFPEISEKNIKALSLKRAAKYNVSPDEMLVRLQNEFADMGPLDFSFDSGTGPAVKQMRDKILMAGIGSVNCEIDEIGSNLVGQTEILNSFLELFDVGKIKRKLTKNTAENRRGEEVPGRTPTNMMLFGTPLKLLNGAKTEEEFNSFLEIGFGRRCFFGYNTKSSKMKNQTPEQIYDMLTDTTTDSYLKSLAHQLEVLADSNNYNVTLDVDKSVELELIKYRIDCETRADKLPDHMDSAKAELEHRYFKAKKLAGAYAFVDGDHEVKSSHLWQAIKLTEDSGKAFDRILHREAPYVKLARFIADVEEDLTHADINEALPFYKGTAAHKQDLMNYAISWGYKNNVIIKKFIVDDIEFFRGESLREVDMSKLNISYSKDVAVAYHNDVVSFDDIGILTKAADYHWINHHLGDIT